MPWGKRKDGRRYFKKSNSGNIIIPPERPNNPKKSTGSFGDDNRRRQEDFIRKKKEELRKKHEQSKKEKKQAKLDRVSNQNLGQAKGFLIKATPALVQLDPTLSSVYTSYKVGMYGYCFLKQVNEDYQKSESYEESLKKVAKQEIERKINSKIKTDALQKGSQYAANMVWAFCKETYSDEKIDPRWNKFAENALAKTFEEVGEKLI